MLKILRYIRHKTFSRFYIVWVFLGNFYRYVLKILNINFSTIHQIQKKSIKLHANFAFSNFEYWGKQHNNLFNTYLKIAKTSKCFFDIGAHIGIVTIPVALNMKSSGLVYSFEPSKKNLFFLKYHVKENNIKNVKIIDKIVSSKTKSNVKFYEANETTGMNSIIKINEKNVTTMTKVKSVSLDDFCKSKNLKPDILKVDIEGSEVDLLIGAKKIISKQKPIIFLSYHTKHLKKLGYKTNDMLEIIKELKYVAYDEKHNKIENFTNKEYILAYYKTNITKLLRDN
jgi:FkbM family methyltransferase